MSKDWKKRDGLKVDGLEYFWKFRHASRFDSEVGLSGPSVVVCQRPGYTRDLIIDFAISAFDPKAKPRKAVLVNHLTSAIRRALVAGWDPKSRGKPFRFNVNDSCQSEPGDRSSIQC